MRHPAHCQVSQPRQKLHPSSLVLLSPEMILSMHNNYTNRGPCLSWTEFQSSHVHHYRSQNWLVPHYRLETTQSQPRHAWDLQHITFTFTDCATSHFWEVHINRSDCYDIIKDVTGVAVQHALKPLDHIFSAIANIISIWSVIPYVVSYLTWIPVICQNKDGSCCARSVLHQANATQQNTSATETSFCSCKQAEKHLNQQMIALIDCTRAPSSHYNSKQHEDIVARQQAPTLNKPSISGSVSNEVNLNSQSEDPCFKIAVRCGG